MIDKLDLRLPRLTQFQPAVRQFLFDCDDLEKGARQLRTQYYAWSSDLRPIGIAARLNFKLLRGDNDPHAGEHKLVLFETGKKYYSDLAALIETIVEGAIGDLEIMRIDLCADIRDVPVSWFLDKARLKYKRVAREIGSLKAERIGKHGIETICAGNRPNVFRAYDKVAECKEKLAKDRRKHKADAGELTLESKYGLRDNDVLTRLEMQIGGGKIPASISTFGRLAALPDYDPFKNLEIVNGTGAGIPTIEECGLDTWLAGMQLRKMRDDMGAQQFNRWLSKHSSGNAARLKRRYDRFLNPEFDGCITQRMVYEVYRQSVITQLAA